jgi:hypothetical protein
MLRKLQKTASGPVIIYIITAYSRYELRKLPVKVIKYLEFVINAVLA